MLDDGFELVVPNQYKWKQSQAKNGDFLASLNFANVNLLMESFDRLSKPASDLGMQKRHNDLECVKTIDHSKESAVRFINPESEFPKIEERIEDEASDNSAASQSPIIS